MPRDRRHASYGIRTQLALHENLYELLRTSRVIEFHVALQSLGRGGVPEVLVNRRLFDDLIMSILMASHVNESTHAITPFDRELQDLRRCINRRPWRSAEQIAREKEADALAIAEWEAQQMENNGVVDLTLESPPEPVQTRRSPPLQTRRSPPLQTRRNPPRRLAPRPLAPRPVSIYDLNLS